MPRSDEAEWWFNAVYAAVQEIPRGKVTSYGHIARLLGQRKSVSYILIIYSVVDTLLLEPFPSEHTYSQTYSMK